MELYDARLPLDHYTYIKRTDQRCQRTSLTLVNEFVAKFAPKSISAQCQAGGQTVKEIKYHILETAQRMLDRFGDEALREAELRATELRECGEMTAAAFWQEVHDALLELRNGGADRTKH